MFAPFRHVTRIIRAAYTLAEYDALVPREFAAHMPAGAIWASRLLQALSRRKDAGADPQATPGRRLAAALHDLGPAYIKLGQFLATRPDIIGADVATGLGTLQDRLPPFAQAEAEAIIAEDLGAPTSTMFDDFGPAVAAASIAQVHRARIAGAPAGSPDVAVKILRPGIERAFMAELAAWDWAARRAERLWPAARRLEPVKFVATLRDSVLIEMDLRLEAAAASELKENDAERKLLRIPTVDWQRTARRVMTLEWIDGISLRDRDALKAAGHDPRALAKRVMNVFLHQALFDGFFHADLHQGNLFADRDGNLVAVDFGIMGRLDRATRRYLAEILYGFLMRDYQRLAAIHFDAGYVPPHQSRDAFAQALRSVGEPIFGQDVSKISMARLLAQLFAITETFDMHLQPQLVLLQKTMVVVEGVARDLDPRLNMWEVSRPVVTRWMEQEMSPEARMRQAAEGAAAGAAALGRILSELPETLRNVETIAAMIRRDSAEHALRRPDPQPADRLGSAAWIGAGALVVIALALVF